MKAKEIIEKLLKYRNDMKQTAVEFLIQELDNYEKGISEYFSEVAIRNNARRMEKQQMHAEYMRGWKDGLTKKQEQ
jgi:hypothetical protein